jgi:hypothetical protein
MRMITVALAMLAGLPGYALVIPPVSAQGDAFERYVNSVGQVHDPGTMEVEIEASLPGLGKHACLIGIRDSGEYRILRTEGDPMVRQQVIARYLSAQAEAAAMPASSLAVTPANYTFRYAGSIGRPGSLVYIYEITPKKNRAGLFKGQIWIDSATGQAVHQDGYLVRRPSLFLRRVELARDAQASGRVTRLNIDTRLVGRAELTITERPVPQFVASGQ